MIIINTLLILLAAASQDTPVAVPETYSMVLQIAAWAVPILLGALVWLGFRHFDLRERVKVLELEMINNKEADLKTEKQYNENLEKLESTMETIQQSVSNIFTEIVIIKTKLKIDENP